MSQNYNAADLHSILKTLSTFSGQTTSTPHQSALNAHDPSGNNGYNDPENDYEPPDAFPSPITHPQAPTHQTSTHSPLTSSSTSHLHQHPTNPPVSSSSTPQAKDSTPPSEITTWPAALKRVMHTVAQNEEIQRRIRVLIQRQHDHEKQWWQGREALLQKQKSRAEKKRELDRVLRSVGAPVDGKEVSTAEEDLAEVQSYDAKVYKASKQMADAMLIELRNLHIPFFCLKQSFIVDEAAKQKDGQNHSPSHRQSGVRPENQNRISSDNLSALQRRMLELLQDLCRE